MRREFANDCIHLKACRRMQKLCKTAGLRIINRHCKKETCTAYKSGEGECYVTVDEALEYARDGANSILSGYGKYDVYCASDLPMKTLGELIE